MSLLARLEGVEGPDDAARFAAAWRVLAHAPEGDDEFDVGLDLAMERGLIPTEFGGLVRGRCEGFDRAASWVNPLDGSEMIWVAPGPFHVGEDRRRCDGPGFFLARRPVTNGQFRRFLDETNFGSTSPAHSTGGLLSHWRGGPIPEGKERHPVVWVSFLDALHYCQWAGLALPTEWLWEKAARGPEGRIYPWGDHPPTGAFPRPYRLAQVRAEDTCDVGSFPRARSPYGCEDLIGNVSEWCWASDPDDAGHWPHGRIPAEPSAVSPTDLSAVRGSAFLRQTHSRMTAHHRRLLGPTRRNRWVGFRPAYYPAAPS